MKLALIIVSLFALIIYVEAQLFHDNNVPDHIAFESFQEHFERDYHPKEKSKRFALFTANRKQVHAMNEKFKLGLVSFESKINQFSDLTKEEFKQYSFSGSRDNIKKPTELVLTENVRDQSRRKRNIPANFDWRNMNAVTPVQNQGDCGSSYAFAAAAVLEARVKLSTGKLLLLSAQEIIDCSSPYGNEGCDGGRVENAFSYVRNNSGIGLSTSYPYEGKSTVCRSTGNKIAPINNYINLIPDESTLQEIVYNEGPVAVAIDASLDSFGAYAGGVYSDPQCDNTGTSDLHWMVVIGYDTSATFGDYWILKNSWGPTWGVKGFMKLARNRNNQCCITCNVVKIN